jgi:hypothetical protein
MKIKCPGKHFDLRRMMLVSNFGYYRSPGIVRIVKCRKQRWARHVARMDRQGTHTKFWCGSLFRNGYFEDKDGENTITLR